MPGLRVAYVRTGERRDRAYLTRADGSTATVHPHGYGDGFPHDLAHLAVERALGIRRGFWGLLAEGVDWERVNDAAGRGGKGVLGTDVAELRLAEAAVALVAGTPGADLDALRSAYAAEGIEPPADLADRVGAARADLDDLAGAWAEVPVDGQLLLEWPG